jgi:hypothetical protein
MRTPYMALLALSGVAAAFLVHLGLHTIDIVVSVYTLIYWATAPFARPLARPFCRGDCILV